MEIKTFKIERLIEYARNPRKNDSVVDRMVGCIKEFGFRIPIVAKSDGSVVDGHLRLKAAKKLGMTEVPVVIADDLTDAQIKAFRLIANQSANWAEWDDELLKLELEDLKNLNFDLDLTGFDLSEVERLLKNDEIEEDDYDEMPPDENTKPISKLGDLWILGNHRLLCGDSTKIKDVKKLMNGRVADMVFCDPPYNVRINNIIGLGSVHHDEFAMASGEMSEPEFIDFLTLVFKNLVAVSKDGSVHYHCMDWKHIYEIMVAGRAAYTKFKQLCVWNKDNGGMGSFYRSKHELIFVFKNGSAAHTNNFELGQHGRYRTNVWDYSGINSFSGRDQENELLKMHPTVKPVKLVADAILDCSLHDELILDLFGGSGTTLIACEETDRRCCVMELDPKYVDTIIRRWQKHTNQKAILESIEKNF
ncbi:MAG: DNA modification methylase [Holosporaceae bacterium]|jgi:DNA modification methylase|nr:DNA modification methylase [Holosporaceae bacterium]